MKQIKNRSLFFSFIIVFCNYSYAQSPSIQWQRSFGGSNPDYGFSVKQTTLDNGYILLGSSSSNNGDISGNHGSDDYVVVKINNSGNIQWQYSYGGTNYDVGNCIANTSDGGYILCGQASSADGDATLNHGDSDYWIVKINNIGAIQWQKSYGGSFEDNGSFIAQTLDGGYIVSGYSTSNDFDVSGNHGLGDYWVLKINATGAIQWQKSFGGSGLDYGGPIKQTLDGGFVICGTSKSNNGDVTGNHGLEDYWIVKINSTGAIQWQKSFGGSGNDYAQDIQLTADGGYIVCGRSNSFDGDVNDNHGNDDYWVLKLDALGAIQWKKSYGGTLFDLASSIIQTSEGGYLISGRSNSVNGDKTNSNGGYDNWLVKINNTGTIEWQENFGGTAYEDAKALIPTTDGGYLVCGESTSNDLDVSGNHGADDIWLVKFYSAVGIRSQNLNSDLSFFPNPCKNDLYVKTETNAPISSIHVLDYTGTIVLSQSFANGQGQIHLKLNLANGIYFLKTKLQNGNESISKLVISD